MFQKYAHKGVESIQPLPTLDRIYAIIINLRGAMIPVELILSPRTAQKLAEELNIQQKIRTGTNLVSELNSHFSVPLTIREENTDVIIAKELFPNPCPTCGRRIEPLREAIERIESRSVKHVHCPLGHRYKGEVKVYYLNIFQENQSSTRTIQTCPQCGSQNVQFLSKTDVFCLDCEWDNLKLIHDRVEICK